MHPQYVVVRWVKNNHGVSCVGGAPWLGIIIFWRNSANNGGMKQAVPCEARKRTDFPNEGEIIPERNRMR